MSDTLDTVARFAAGTRASDLPPEAMERTKLILADSIGAIVGGMAEPEVKALADRLAGGGTVRVPGHDGGFSPERAALLMGTAGTTLEMDEGNAFARGHPAMHAIPAMLATGGDVSGADFLTGLAVAYEIGARVGIASALNPGLHPHGTWGTVCAAVGVQQLAGADAARMRAAINMAATLGTTTSRRTMLEGATVRNAFTGQANRTGLTIHDLLEAGYTASADDLGHVYGSVASTAYHANAMTDALGQRWEVTRNYFKLHACCRFNHAALDALAMLMPLDPARVRAVRVETYAYAAELSDPAPRTVLGAKFSVPFAIATTLLNGTSGVESFAVDQVSRADIRALAARVTVAEDSALSARLPAERPARVTVTLDDGTAREAFARTNAGDHDAPYPPESIREKYLSLTARRWPRADAERVWDAIMTLDERARAADVLNGFRGQA